MNDEISCEQNWEYLKEGIDTGILGKIWYLIDGRTKYNKMGFWQHYS